MPHAIAIVRRIVTWPLLCAAALVPVVALPFFPEQFEFPKLLFLCAMLLCTIIAGTAVWLRGSRGTFRRTPLDLPIAVGWATVVVATAFSVDRTASVFGGIRSAGSGLIAYTAYAMLTLALARVTRAEHVRRQVVAALGVGLLLSALAFWAGRLGLLASLRLYVPGGYFTSALASQFGLAMVIGTILACGMLATAAARGASGRTHRLSVALWSVVLISCCAAVVALRFRMLWALLVLGAVVLLVAYFRSPERFRPRAAYIVHGLLALSVVFLLVGTPSALTARLPTELSLTHGRSLQIATDALRAGPRAFIVGTGPETFPYAFSVYRPAEYNAQPLWNIRFRRPVASTYEALVSTGMLGVLGSLTIIVSVCVLLVRRRPPRLPIPVLAAWIASLAALGVAVFGVAMWFLSSVLLGVLAGSLGAYGRATAPVVSAATGRRHAVVVSGAMVAAIVVSAFAIIGIVRWTGGAVWYARGLAAAARRQHADAEHAHLRAIAWGPERAEVHLDLAAARLQAAADAPHDAPTDPARAGSLLAGAIAAARRATALAPRSVAGWERLAALYAHARPLTAEANGWAADALDHAMTLEPTYPRLVLLRASTHQRAGRVVEAEADVDRAIALKPDYAAAHYAKSLLLERQGDRDGAVAAAEFAVRFAPRSFDAPFNLGRLRYNRNASGDWAQAEEIFRAILARNRDYANAQYALALLLERQGRTDEAQAQYAALAAIAPGNADVRARLERLRSAGASPDVPPSPEELLEEGATTNAE